MAKYVVWGTGIQAKIILDKYMSNFFEARHSVEYFVDNDAAKWGEYFLGKEVCAPARLLDGKFDKIFICNAFVNDIRMQLTCQLFVDADKIVCEDDIRREIYKNYIDMDIKNKKVLIIGNTHLYRSVCGRYRGIFNNIEGVVDYNHIEDCRKDFDYIILMDLMAEDRDGVDRKKGRIVVEREAIKHLLEQWNISRDQILTDGDYRAIASFPFQESYGEQNEDKTFWVIRLSGSNGLAAMMARVWDNCKVAKSMGYIPVVDATREYSPYLSEDEIGHVNAWEKFFEQPGGYSLEDIKYSKNVWICPEDSSSRGAILDKTEICNLFRVKPAIEKKAIEYAKKIKNDHNKVLAVKYRGSDYQVKRPYFHPIQPSLAECISTVESKMAEWGYDKIFLATETQEAVTAFEKKFGEKLCYVHGNRISNDVNDYTIDEFKKIEDPFESAVLYYIEMYTMSLCDALISSQCSSTRVVMTMNRDCYEHSYIFNLGTYGIDDV